MSVRDAIDPHLRRFTARLRDPDAPLPRGVTPARMDLYRGLVYRNIDSSLAACFPVVRSIVGDDAWAALLADFIARHRCTTPLYRRLPGEFVAYLERERGGDDDPPFLRELAHYEWIELELALDPAEAPKQVPYDPDGSLSVSPLARILDYAFPVHRLSRDYAPHLPPPTPTYLIVYRDREHAVGFIEINALTHALLTLMIAEPGQRASALLARMAAQTPDIEGQQIIDGGDATLRDLHHRSVIACAR